MDDDSSVTLVGSQVVGPSPPGPIRQASASVADVDVRTGSRSLPWTLADGAPKSGPAGTLLSKWRVFALLASGDMAGILAAAAAGFPASTMSTPLSALALVMPAMLYLQGGYRVDPLLPPWREVARCLIAVISGVILVLAAVGAAGLWPVSSLDRFQVPLLVALILWPVAWRALIGRWIRARGVRMRWLVLGGQECLLQFLSDHERARGHGDLVLLATDATCGDGGGAPASVTAGSWDSCSDWLERSWTGIVITEPASLSDQQVRRLMLARLQGAKVYDLMEFYERHWEKVPVHNLREQWVALSNGFRLLHDPISLRLKRVMDVLVASTMAVSTAPLLLLVSIAVRLSSRGPILFRQERVGYRGQCFALYKFRTMRIGSEAGDRYTRPRDERVTWIGRFLRRTRIDELPQLWNVLVGDMSFIGPRAEWIKCASDYEQVIPFYNLRHMVKPGMTGWAQVNYPYGASVEDAREKLQYDLYYLKNHSLLLDMLILLKTVRTVLFGMGR